MTINVTKISRIDWSKYKYAVCVADYPIGKRNYIEGTLKRWFGAVEFFWGTGDGGKMFLCGLK